METRHTHIKAEASIKPATGIPDSLRFEPPYYQYEQLQDKREIRLVKVYPFLESDRVHLQRKEEPSLLRLQLVHASLDSAPKFTGISYTWGLFEPKDICIGGQYNFRTSTRVLEILTRLRPGPGEEPVFLWIDQLCIDQENEEEKWEQIRIMRHIYGEANEVQIVLSDIDESADAVLLAIGNLALNGLLPPKLSTRGNLRSDMSDHGDFTLVHRAWTPDKIPEPASAVFTNPNFQADFEAVCTNQVFQRAWIYQEITSSRRAFVAGKKSYLDWDTFASAVEIHRAIQRSSAQSMSLVRPHTAALELMVDDRITRLAGRHKDWMLLHVQAQGVLKASNPRDQTIALTTFEGFYNQIPPYHKLSVSALYEVSAKSMISTSKTLDVWAAISGEWHSPQRLSEGMPSWVPDWSAARDIIPFYWPLRDTPFNAAKGFPHLRVKEALARDGAQVLIVRGKQIDTVTTVVEPPFDAAALDTDVQRFLNLQQIGKFWLDHAQAAGSPLVERLEFETIRPLMRALIAAVTASCISDGTDLNFTSRIEESLLDEMRWMYVYAKELDDGAILYHDGRPHFMSFFPRMYGSWKAGLQVFKGWTRICVGRRIVFGRTQGFGLVPRTTKFGDIVCILHGSKVPVILRRLGRCYRLIGQCYWHDWMYGERVDWAEDEGDEFKII